MKAAGRPRRGPGGEEVGEGGVGLDSAGSERGMGGAQRMRDGGGEEHQATHFCLLEQFTFVCKIQQQVFLHFIMYTHIYLYR